MKYTIKELPADQRPYEKCSRYGCDSLSDAELLAVILRTGTGGSTSVDLACKYYKSPEEKICPDCTKSVFLNFVR